MDDPEFEARLRRHLHRQLDHAGPSPQLTASVEHMTRTVPRPQRLVPDLRLGSRRPSLPILAVAALAAVMAVVGFRLASELPSGGPQPSRTPLATPAPGTHREFIVLAAFGASPSPDDRRQATQVLMDRLAPYGLEGATSAQPEAIIFELSLDGPPDAVVRDMLAATGDVAFVPLPETYGDGTYTAEVGQPLPTREPPLFGSEAIASVARTFDQDDREVLSIDLRPEAAEAFADYTTDHVGDTFAIVIDGNVALLPRVNEPVLDGAIQVSGAGLPGSRELDQLQVAMAILVGGRLPEAWGRPRVPQLVSSAQVIEAALREQPDSTVTGIQLGAEEIERQGEWEAIWRITLEGEFRNDCGTADAPRVCTYRHLVSTVDATTGEGIRVELTT